MIRRFWFWFRTPSLRYGAGVLFVVGGIGGVIFWGGFNTFMEHTNTLGFCISCHEMRDTVYEEYKTSVHYKNPSGVRAICSDCHVPRPWTAKLWRKIKATNELFHKVAGTIDTPEKFEAHRLEMAERVWAEMAANDSRECRNCHDYGAMHFEKQRRRSAEKMREAVKEGKTCIECHKFIAHAKPEGYEDADR
jgi:nitrate/TMAO reductase-like tetraheme cytochrome c subunit